MWQGLIFTFFFFTFFFLSFFLFGFLFVCFACSSQSIPVPPSPMSSAGGGGGAGRMTFKPQTHLSPNHPTRRATLALPYGAPTASTSATSASASASASSVASGGFDTSHVTGSLRRLRTVTVCLTALGVALSVYLFSRVYVARDIHLGLLPPPSGVSASFAADWVVRPFFCCRFVCLFGFSIILARADLPLL